MSAQVLIQSISEINLPRINLKKVFIFGFILITSLIVFYIFQINEVTQVSFSISKYGKEINALSQQNKDLEVILSKGGFLANLEEAIQKLHYEKVSKIYYIQVSDGEMAVRR